MRKKIKEIEPDDIWSEKEVKGLREFIIAESFKQSEERKIRNELLGIKFRMEDYINCEEIEEKLQLVDFVKMYLQTLNITQKALADLFEMKDSNLHKYLNGERKLNADLVLKLSAFSNLDPEYWFRIEVKNELLEIKAEQAKAKDYSKYDYRNLVQS